MCVICAAVGQNTFHNIVSFGIQSVGTLAADRREQTLIDLLAVTLSIFLGISVDRCKN